MSRNAGLSFLRGFQGTFNPTFQNVLANLQQKDRQREIMDEQNRRVEEERQLEQGQRKTVMDLLRGNETLNIPQGLTPILPQGINATVPYTGKQVEQKITSLDTYGRDYYDWMSKYTAPKQQKTVEFDGKMYLEDPYLEGVPKGEAIYELPKEKEIRPNWKEKRIVGGKIIVPFGYTDTEGNWVETDFEEITPTEPKKTEYDTNYTDLTKVTKDTLNSYNKTQEEIKARLDTVRKGIPVVEKSWWGGEIKLSEEDLLKQLNQVNGEYLEYVQNTEPSTVVTYKNDFVKKYGEIQPGDEDDLFNYWEKVYNSYKEGEIEPSDFLYLLNDFRAKYRYDPDLKYRSALDAGKRKN
jgi:hypothetical protein